MKIHINLLVTMLFCISLKAQDAVEVLTPPLPAESISASTENELYQKEAIYLKNSFWKGQLYVKNGVEHRFGFMGNKIKKEFEGYPAAAAEFKKYQKTRKKTIIIGFAGVGMMATSLIMHSKRAAKTPDDEVIPNATEGSIYLGGAGVAVVASAWGTLSSNNSLQKAIFLRNEALRDAK
jgi:hypothetical protein